MKDGGQSRKDSTGPKASSSNKALRIASWNVRTMYETGKSKQVSVEMKRLYLFISKQVSVEMKRYNLHILGVSETRWTQSGQKHLSSGELILYSGREDKHHSGGVGILLNKLAQKTLSLKETTRGKKNCIQWTQ